MYSLPSYARVRGRQILRTVCRRSFYELWAEGVPRIPYGPGPYPSAICQKSSNLVHMGDAPPADRGLRCPVAGKESEAVEGEMPPREARRARMRKMGLMLALMALGLLVATRSTAAWATTGS